MPNEQVACALLRVTTVINFTNSILRRFNSMVYLYDYGWEPTSDPDTVDTLPFAFLEVIKETVLQKCAVSKKRLILFEPANKSLDTDSVSVSKRSYRPGVINIIADNIVNEPVIHRLECLVPANAVSNLIETNLRTADSVLSAISIGIGGGIAVKGLDILRSILVGIGVSARIIKRSFDIIRTFSGRNNDYNRRSLLLMARKRAILKYKTWSSWETRSVVITNIDIQKIGTEDDYFRATIELEELPILYVGPVSDYPSPEATNSRLTGIIKKSFESITSFLEDGSSM